MWFWSAVLIFITISVHVGGIAVLARALRPFRQDDVDRDLTMFDSGPGVIAVVVATACALAVLHGIECLIWAAAYLRLGAFSRLFDAMLYSVGSMTTRGASDLPLRPEWRLMGAIEAGDGMLLFGISTAFLFSLMLHLWRIRSPRSG